MNTYDVTIEEIAAYGIYHNISIQLTFTISESVTVDTIKIIDGKPTHEKMNLNELYDRINFCRTRRSKRGQQQMLQQYGVLPDGSVKWKLD